MAGLQARLSPEGHVAQRFEVSFNGRGNWVVLNLGPGEQLIVTVLEDEDVQDWPRLVEEPEVSA